MEFQSRRRFLDEDPEEGDGTEGVFGIIVHHHKFLPCCMDPQYTRFPCLLRDKTNIRKPRHLVGPSFVMDEGVWKSFLAQAVQAAQFDVRLRVRLMLGCLIIPVLIFAVLFGEGSGQHFWEAQLWYYVGGILGFVVFEPFYILCQDRLLFRPAQDRVRDLLQANDNPSSWSQIFAQHGVLVESAERSVGAPYCPSFVLAEKVFLIQFTRIPAATENNKALAYNHAEDHCM